MVSKIIIIPIIVIIAIIIGVGASFSNYDAAVNENEMSDTITEIEIIDDSLDEIPESDEGQSFTLELSDSVIANSP